MMIFMLCEIYICNVHVWEAKFCCFHVLIVDDMCDTCFVFTLFFQILYTDHDGEVLGTPHSILPKYVCFWTSFGIHASIFHNL
jgi:hypothetical protein